MMQRSVAKHSQISSNACSFKHVDTMLVMRGSGKYQHGMTLLELVIVIVVLGILSGVASVKMGSASSLTMQSQTQLVAAHIRQLQSLAFNWGCDLKMVVAGSGYSVSSRVDYTGTDKETKCGDTVSLVKIPGRFEDFNIQLENNLSFSVGGTLYIDSMGRPTDATGLPISANTDFMVSDSANNWRIRVSPLTAFVTITKL